VLPVINVPYVLGTARVQVAVCGDFTVKQLKGTERRYVMITDGWFLVLVLAMRRGGRV
jgi:hypothetical protein